MRHRWPGRALYVFVGCAAVLVALLLLALARGSVFVFSPARADYQRGQELAAASMWPEAVQAWQSAIHRDPSFVPAYRRLAGLYEQQGNNAAAAETWQACYRHAPDAPHVLCHLAEDEAAVGLEAPALRDGQAEIKRRPSCPIANFVVGQLLARTSLQREALACLARAVSAYPTNLRLRLLYTRLLVTDGRAAAAIAQARAALKQAPRDAEALYELGSALDHSQAGDPGAQREAAASLKEALTLQPSYPAADAELGSLYVSMGRAAEAIPHFRRSLAQDPHQPQVVFSLAAALRLSGETQQYQEALRRFQTEAALDEQEKTLQKRYAVDHSLKTGLELAALYLHAGDTSSAGRVAKFLLMDHPGSPEARALAARLGVTAPPDLNAGAGTSQ